MLKNVSLEPATPELPIYNSIKVQNFADACNQDKNFKRKRFKSLSCLKPISDQKEIRIDV
jgi:hypothetical protein